MAASGRTFYERISLLGLPLRLPWDGGVRVRVGRSASRVGPVGRGRRSWSFVIGPPPENAHDPTPHDFTSYDFHVLRFSRPTIFTSYDFHVLRFSRPTIF